MQHGAPRVEQCFMDEKSCEKVLESQGVVSYSLCLKLFYCQVVYSNSGVKSVHGVQH